MVNDIEANDKKNLIQIGITIFVFPDIEINITFC